MRIGIEAQRIFRENKHGMDFVALESIREIQKIDKINEYFIFVSPGKDRCLEESDNVHIIEINFPFYPLWEQLFLPLTAKKYNLDLLHCTSNTAPLFPPCPMIVTLHDIIFLEKRQSSNMSLYQEFGWYYRKLIVPLILPKCKKIITVSNFECNRIKERLNLSSEKITAIYNAYNPHFVPISKDTSVTKKYIDSDEFIFFLGNTDPKKNVARTLKAYSLYLEKSTKKLPLLIADLSEENLDKILKEKNIANIKKHLAFPGYIYNTDLAQIYNSANIFIYTSLRESFGIPILEAMASGTPVLTSNTSAMPEIAGEGGVFADPLDENDIASKLLKLEGDPDFYQQQVEYGLDRAKAFSWENTAKKLIELYKIITNLQKD